jgi:hypothetical protein
MKKEKKNFVPLKIRLREKRKTTPPNGEEKAERKKKDQTQACGSPILRTTHCLVQK